MKISSRVDGSVCAVLSNRPSARLAATTVRRSFCAVRDGGGGTHRKRLAADFFCARSSLWLLKTFTPATELRRTLPIHRPRHAAKSYGTAADAARHSGHSTNPTHRQDPDHLMSFVRQEDSSTLEEHLQYYQDPYRRGYAQPDGQKLEVSDKRRDFEHPTKEETCKGNDETRRIVAKLCSAVSQKLRRPYYSSLGPIYDIYLQLPEPRMLHLTWQWRDKFLRVMGLPPKRDSESMLRYFKLLGDVRNVGLTLRRTHWNLAMAFATKYAGRATSTEMETALRIWREMERGAGIKGNEVTFNILFDVASKVGNYTLAEMIYREMENRGIPYNRYHHVSVIHYFGLQMDSAGIRAAYRDMVEAGEMIDTVVLNCVISGLLRCGEEVAAEETYRKMRDVHSMAPDLPDRNYGMPRVVTKVLMMFSRVGRKHPELGKSLQKQIELSPNLHTYKLFVEHYCIRIGDLAKVARYLDEMKFLRITIHPTIFLALFKGFYSHGGYSSSEWSEQRLEGVLKAMYQAKDEGVRGFRIDRWLVIWALRAVKKCSSNEAVVRVYDELAKRWDIAEDRIPFIQSLFDNVLNGSDMKSPMGRWDGPSYRRYKKDGTRL
ncbi:hypothetical protein BHE90_005680 [Fusarium euwallaceae]|uniref:Pentacotripeptide-repeat region of PRORP domain-containing protein n=1 Tax=Fusarium euwallaceae TaxID=1147111 RepID=A0A430LVV3_9HYPO|nr:hypothetical protein BHE90_005680 [Fusarium euwallaceae]